MIKRFALAAAAFVVLAGCGGHQGLTGIPGHTMAQGARPGVLQSGKTPVNWTQFKWGGASGPQEQGIVAGPDGNMWYTDYSDSDLIKMTMSGATHAFPLPSAGPIGIAVGSDGKFYMGLYGQAKIGIATTSGSFSTVAIPSGDRMYDGNPALGPDGNIWFAELAHIGRITPSGVITEYPYPNGETGNSEGAVAAGPNGDVWVSDSGSNVVDDVDPETGDIVAYRIPCTPNGLVAPSDGNLWTICTNDTLVRLTPGGNTTSYFVPSAPQYPSGMTVGPDGNPWFAFGSGNAIAEFNIGQTTLNIYLPPTNYAFDYGIASGPDGNVWAVDSAGKIDVYIIKTISVAPKNLTFTSLGSMQNITVTEKSASAWTAASSNTSVATVAQGTPANTFVVTSVADGKCTITVSDAIGNSAAVSVTVTGAVGARTSEPRR
ncbi:MAG TPA: hypothetical protein VKT51_11190 [Candidatus Eremiobacteraceae bacterium]|nr:hypothetical protein [Candidatus Eremiobacteraceae bacterium]